MMHVTKWVAQARYVFRSRWWLEKGALKLRPVPDELFGW